MKIDTRPGPQAKYSKHVSFDPAYNITALRAENARLRAALDECITDDGAICFEHREYLARRVGVVSDIARAALKGAE